MAEIFEYLSVVSKRLDRLNDERHMKITLWDREVLMHSYPVTFYRLQQKLITDSFSALVNVGLRSLFSALWFGFEQMKLL